MKKTLFIQVIIGVVVCILMSGCSVGPDYVKPEISTPEGFKYAKKEEPPAKRSYKNWWEIFDDKVLNLLIQEAEMGNYDLMAALERVKQARAAARMSKSGLLPSIGFDPSVQRRKSSETLKGANGETNTVYTAPFKVGYELDLFGRVRRDYEAGVAEAEAAHEYLKSIRLVLHTDLAANYFSMRSIDEEINIVSRNYDLRYEQLKLLKSRFKFGVISQLPVSQARAELNATKALLYALKRERAKLENAIAVLIGKAPSEIALDKAPLKSNPPRIPSVVPSALLNARPDIRRVERQLAAENARIGVATASFFPQISLSGDAGFATSHISTLFDSRSFTWGIGPNIHIPLFEGGRNSANLERAKARYAEVYANYRQIIVRSFGEVEDALVSVDFLKKQAESNRLAVKSSRKAHNLSKKQFEGGLINYLSVLDSERTLLENMRQSSQIRGQRYISAVNLIKAIGGSW